MTTTNDVANQLKRYVENLETDPTPLEQTNIVQALFDANKSRYATKLQEKDDEVVNVTQQMAVKDGELTAKDGALDAKDKELAAKVEELETKDNKITALENKVDKIKAKFQTCKNMWEEKGRSDAHTHTAQIASLEAQNASLKKQIDEFNLNLSM